MWQSHLVQQINIERNKTKNIKPSLQDILFLFLSQSFAPLLHLLSVQEEQLGAVEEVAGVEAALHAVEMNLCDLERGQPSYYYNDDIFYLEKIEAVVTNV